MPPTTLKCTIDNEEQRMNGSSQQDVWASFNTLKSHDRTPKYFLIMTGLLCRRVLARISKMPVQNSNFKISARPDLATNLLQILIPATINSLVCQKGQFTLQLCPRRWFVRKIFGYYTNEKNYHRTFCLSKQELFRKLPVQKTGRTGPG